jgi:glycosyltransferase involved in cell wall biosynthesis
VLILMKTTALGGAERLVMNTLPHLDTKAFDYRIAALDAGGPLAIACAGTGHPFASLPHRVAADPRTALALRRRLVRERIDLVHAHLPLPGALARVAARGLATRVVYTEHASQDVYRSSSRWLNAASYPWQDAVIAVSNAVRRSAERSIGPAAHNAIQVIPNGVDLAQLDRSAARSPGPLPDRPNGTPILLVPASLAPVKGHNVLFDALARMRARGGPPVRAWLAGGGPRERLVARCRALGIDDQVHFLGWRPDVFALMRIADLVVLPSRREGHPLALLEALALGRPALASAVGGIPEIIHHGRTGWLVPSGDPEALVRALQRLCADPGTRARLGRAAARDARHRFDVRRHVSALEALYRKTCWAPAPGWQPQVVVSDRAT